MKTSFALSAAVSLMLASFVAPSVRGVEILPVSYIYDAATDTGSYAYHDETGVQLIDGKYGIAPWSADLGNGPAYEWLGWVWDNPVNIDFSFAGLTSIGEIHVGTVQDNLTDVVIPNVAVYSWNGTGWTFVKSVLTPESTANDNTYMTIVLDQLGISSDKVRVSLSFSYDGPWTFTDEVDFFRVPEPVSTAVLLGLGWLGLVACRRVSKGG